MITANEFYRSLFHEKVYKLSLNGGMTCPNRDGTLGTRGCIFCSAGGSGDFAPSPLLSPDEQIEEAKKLVSHKFKGNKYIAYFQAYTNTYAPAERLKELFFPVVERDDIAALDIATRPDCLGPEILTLLSDLNRIRPVIIELGLQTVKRESIAYIRRGYENEVYDRAVSDLNSLGIHTVTHVILGLPKETEEDMKDTVRHAVSAGTKGIKLQLLHVLRGTDLSEDYRAGLFDTLTLDEYVHILRSCLSLLPDDLVLHRITGDGPKALLEAPLWSADKKSVLNRLRAEKLIP